MKIIMFWEPIRGSLRSPNDLRVFFEPIRGSLRSPVDLGDFEFLLKNAYIGLILLGIFSKYFGGKWWKIYGLKLAGGLAPPRPPIGSAIWLRFFAH